MPPFSSLEPGTPTPEQETTPASPVPSPSGNRPVSFVPHDSNGAIQQESVRIRAGRYGELDHHELIRLLDTIEDERARSRFRESIYISCFIWLVLAWVGFYGPKYLWHAPKVIDPMTVLRERELTQLNLPMLTPHAVPRPAAPPPKIDEKTLEHMRELTREHAVRNPEPPPPTPVPIQPQPTAAPNIPPPPVPTPQPRTPPPVVADAPAPQPSTRPNFNTNPSTPGDAMSRVLAGAAGDHSTGNYSNRRSGGPLNMGGAEILSDTQGVNFNAYIQRILRDIKRNWDPLIPEEAQPPLMKQGETYIRFTILPNGDIGEMHLDGSTHDDAINHSCWSAITTEGQYPPLPSQFHGPNLELRIHFLVNKQIE